MDGVVLQELGRVAGYAFLAILGFFGLNNNNNQEGMRIPRYAPYETPIIIPQPVMKHDIHSSCNQGVENYNSVNHTHQENSSACSFQDHALIAQAQSYIYSSNPYHTLFKEHISLINEFTESVAHKESTNSIPIAFAPAHPPKLITSVSRATLENQAPHFPLTQLAQESFNNSSLYNTTPYYAPSPGFIEGFKEVSRPSAYDVLDNVERHLSYINTPIVDRIAMYENNKGLSVEESRALLQSMNYHPNFSSTLPVNEYSSQEEIMNFIQQQTPDYNQLEINWSLYQSTPEILLSYVHAIETMHKAVTSNPEQFINYPGFYTHAFVPFIIDLAERLEKHKNEVKKCIPFAEITLFRRGFEGQKNFWQTHKEEYSHPINRAYRLNALATVLIAKPEYLEKSYPLSSAACTLTENYPRITHLTDKVIGNALQHAFYTECAYLVEGVTSLYCSEYYQGSLNQLTDIIFEQASIALRYMKNGYVLEAFQAADVCWELLSNIDDHLQNKLLEKTYYGCSNHLDLSSTEQECLSKDPTLERISKNSSCQNFDYERIIGFCGQAIKMHKELSTCPKKPDSIDQVIAKQCNYNSARLCSIAGSAAIKATESIAHNEPVTLTVEEHIVLNYVSDALNTLTLFHQQDDTVVSDRDPTPIPLASVDEIESLAAASAATTVAVVMLSDEEIRQFLINYERNPTIEELHVIGFIGEIFKKIVEANKLTKCIKANTMIKGNIASAYDLLEKKCKEFESRVLQKSKNKPLEKNKGRRIYFEYADGSSVQLRTIGNSGHPKIDIVDKYNNIVEKITYI